MFSSEELHSNCFFPLFCSNLTSAFEINHEINHHHEINQNSDSQESS